MYESYALERGERENPLTPFVVPRYEKSLALDKRPQTSIANEERKKCFKLLSIHTDAAIRRSFQKSALVKKRRSSSVNFTHSLECVCAVSAYSYAARDRNAKVIKWMKAARRK